MRVAINGAGVAGPTLAYWLMRYGHEAVLFEAAPRLRTSGYMIDFWGLGYDVAERMGLLPKLHARGYHLNRLALVDERGASRASVDIQALRERIDGRFVSIPRGDIAATIFEACDGVEARFSTSIERIDQHSDGAVVTLSHGGEERFDLVVGADGLHSRVRAVTFGAEAECVTDLGCCVAAFRLPGYRPRDELAYISHTVPGRQVGRVSLRDDATLVLMVWLADSGDWPTDTQGTKALLRTVFGDMGWEVPRILKALGDVEAVYCDRVSQVKLDRWTSGRVALVGDAAACASFLAGEGTGLAMTEAYVLAGELHRSGGHHEAAFRAYEDRLRGLLRDKQQGATRNIGFFAPRSRWGLKLRDWLTSLANRPLVARRLVASALDDTMVLPDYAPGASTPDDAPHRE